MFQTERTSFFGLHSSLLFILKKMHRLKKFLTELATLLPQTVLIGRRRFLKNPCFVNSPVQMSQVQSKQKHRLGLIRVVFSVSDSGGSRSREEGEGASADSGRDGRPPKKFWNAILNNNIASIFISKSSLRNEKERIHTGERGFHIG